jgi:hypothetical protein
MKIENTGKHHAKLHGFTRFLTYNEITDNSAETLAVAGSFSENRPAHVCGLRRSLENKTAPIGLSAHLSPSVQEPIL